MTPRGPEGQCIGLNGGDAVIAARTKTNDLPHSPNGSPVASAAAPPARGRRLALPRSRRLVTDLLHFSKKLPTQALVRQCRVERLAALQRTKEPGPRIGWPVLFLRAYGLMSARHPELRRCYMPWPWPHLYEHPHPVGRITVARRHLNEDWVFFGHIPRPDVQPLTALQDLVLSYKDDPVSSIPKFRQQVVFSGLPRPLRRLAWWATMNVSGGARAERLGTFGVTTVASKGAISIHPPSLAAIMLTFGPVDAEGRVRVTMVYDHRLFDGLPVAGYLEEVEATLNGPVLEELAALKEDVPAHDPRLSSRHLMAAS